MNQIFHVEPQSRLSDIVMSRPATMTVLARLGIVLGLGDDTVEMVSRRLGISTRLLTSMLNTLLNPDFVPRILLDSHDHDALNDYLAKSNAYYRHVALPNIERHFEMLVTKSGTSNNLELMLRFFHELKQQWVKCLDGATSAVGNDAPADTTDSIENRIGDLMSMIVIHLQGSYDANLALAVLLAVSGLRDDIALNNRIRNLVTHPGQHGSTQE